MSENNLKPPYFLKWLLSKFVIANDRGSILGDCDEEYSLVVKEKNKIEAVRWYTIQVLISILPFLRTNLAGNLSMFKNYLKIAIRSTIKYKGISFINISGLAVGLACSILLFVFIIDELSFDCFHGRSDRIYRLESELIAPDGSISRLSTNGWPVGKLLTADYPEIDKCVHIRSASHPVTHQGLYLFDRMLYTDNNFLDVFSFPVINGDPETALERPFTMVITEEMESKYFGEESALGQTLTLSDTLVFSITGVVTVPKTSHIQFDMLLSFETWLKFNPEARGEAGWGNFNMHHYLLLNPETNIEEFRDKITDFPMQKAEDMFNSWGFKCYLNISPVENIYLNSEIGNNLGPASSMRTIYFLLIIAGLLLLIGCFNFINLTTARSVERAKEVGLRKVVGSTRKGLVRQFLIESLFVCFIAMILALLIMILILPVFNDLTGKQYAILDIFGFNTILFVVLFTTSVGILASFYPAFVLSCFKPVDVLKGKFSRGSYGVKLRKSMVVFQFIITTGLIFCTLIIRDQLSYMMNSDLGFSSERVIVMNTARIPWSSFTRQKNVLKQALLEDSSIRSVTASFSVPGRNGWRGQVCTPEGFSKYEILSVEYIPADYDYVKTFDLEIIAGRDFSKEMSTDEANALLINEASVKAMRWGTSQEAIGKRIDSPSGYPRGTVVGVFKDYNHHSLRSKVNAIVIDAVENVGGVIALKTSTDEIPRQLDSIQNIWEQFFPGYPFDYFFLDEFFDRQYRQEARLSNTFGLFAILAVIIACLGLFGLVAFSTSQRTREIGIKKVLGASASGISMNLMGDYLILTAFSSVMAIPPAYFLMERWLTDFAYRINIGIDSILLSTLFTIALAVLTVSYRAIRAATSNPVDSLRYE